MTAAAHALDKRLDLKVVGSDVVHRRDHAVEHVIAAAELAGAFDRDHIARVGNHTDDRRVALVRRTDGAHAAVCQIAADGAAGDRAFGVQDGVGKFFGVLLRKTEHMKGKTLRALAADAGEAGKLLDQLFQCRREVFHDLNLAVP